VLRYVTLNVGYNTWAVTFRRPMKRLLCMDLGKVLHSQLLIG